MPPTEGPGAPSFPVPSLQPIPLSWEFSSLGAQLPACGTPIPRPGARPHEDHSQVQPETHCPVALLGAFPGDGGAGLSGASWPRGQQVARPREEAEPLGRVGR